MRMHLYAKVSESLVLCLLSVAYITLCMHVESCERKPLSGSCVVWMSRPLSAAYQDAPS